MRSVSRTTRRVLATFGAALIVGAAAGTIALRAEEQDEDETDAAALAEQKRVAQEALDKAVERGRVLWSSKERYKKPCSTCHDAADKPHLNLATREYSYPAYSRAKRSVVTLQQKLQEMITLKSRGQAFDDKGTEIADLAAYVMSLKKAK